jgi:hypothetical protein
MSQTEEYTINDTTRAIRSIMDHLKDWESTKADPRTKAMVISQLEIAELLSLRLIKEED